MQICYIIGRNRPCANESSVAVCSNGGSGWSLPMLLLVNLLSGKTALCLWSKSHLLPDIFYNSVHTTVLHAKSTFVGQKLYFAMIAISCTSLWVMYMYMHFGFIYNITRLVEVSLLTLVIPRCLIFVVLGANITACAAVKSLLKRHIQHDFPNARQSQ